MTVDPDPLAALTTQAIAESAVAATGLDDFGGDLWREGLDVLTAALRTEARLNPIGVASFGDRIGSYLQNRLRVVDWLRRHPEIADETVTDPVIITGLPRTGTTALSNLLAQDPDTRSLLVWESASPVPPPEAATYRTDPRIAATQAGMDLLDEFLPELKVMHDDTATSTAEAIDLLGMSYRTEHFCGMATVPSYEHWWMGCDMVGAYEFHRSVLQLLQWRCPPTRWHLKNPPDVFCLDAVRSVYPDAVFVWTHRDPARVLASVSNLIALITGTTTDHVDRPALGRYLLEVWATGIDRALAFRHRTGGAGFVDVYLTDLVRDPIATVAAAYEAIGWPFTAAAETSMAAWAEANPPGRHGHHEPDPAEFGLSAEAVHERFAVYCDRFLPDLRRSRTARRPRSAP